MNYYSIGEVAEKTNLSIYTIRYYDKEGLLPFIERTASGVRRFKDSDLGVLHIIECLKLTGMPIKEIKEFMEWCAEGDATLEKRYKMFLERRVIVQKQMEELQKTMDTIEMKCDYYEKAIKVGTEKIHQK